MECLVILYTHEQVDNLLPIFAFKPKNVVILYDYKYTPVKNLEYIKMTGFDECCGLNGISNIKEYKTLSKIFNKKRENIHNTQSQNVLTSCLGCETALKLYSFNKYKVTDLIEFLAKNL